MTAPDDLRLDLADVFDLDSSSTRRRPPAGLVLSVIAEDGLGPDTEPELCLQGKLVCPPVGALELFYPAVHGTLRLLVRGVDADATRALLLAASSAGRLDLDGPALRERMRTWDDVRLTGTLQYGPSVPGLLEPTVQLLVRVVESVSTVARAQVA